MATSPGVAIQRCQECECSYLWRGLTPGFSRGGSGGTSRRRLQADVRQRIDHSHALLRQAFRHVCRLKSSRNEVSAVTMSSTICSIEEMVAPPVMTDTIVPPVPGPWGSRIWLCQC